MRKLPRLHGESKTRLHNCWTEIKRRCLWSGADNFHNYGGRGITVHPPWVMDYRRFAAYVRKHIGDPRPGMSIDRIDNERGYVPGNIRWADRVTQSSNTRRNVWVEYDGKRMTMKQWAAHLNINYWTLVSRIKKRKMPIAVALSSAKLPTGGAGTKLRRQRLAV